MFVQGLDGFKGDKGTTGLPGKPGEPGLRGKDVSKSWAAVTATIQVVCAIHHNSDVFFLYITFFFFKS